jgi:protein-histidine pros-kinase
MDPRKRALGAFTQLRRFSVRGSAQSPRQSGDFRETVSWKNDCVSPLLPMIDASRIDAFQLFEAVLTACPCGLAALDANRRVELWSPGATRITGWTQEEVLGQACPLFSGLESGFLIAERPGEIRSGDFGWKKRDGTPFAARVQAAAYGTQGGAVLLIHDVTESFDLYAEHLTARQTAAEFVRFRSLLDAAPDAILEVNNGGQIVLANQAAERIFGYSADDLIGAGIEMLVPEANRAAHAQYRSSYMETPGIRPMGTGLRLYARRKDGSQFPAEITLSPMRIEGELHVASAVRDVTEKDDLTGRLRQSAEQAELLFAASPAPCWVYERGTLRFLAVNDEAIRTFGFSREDLLGRTILDLRPVDDHAAILERLAELPEGTAYSGPWPHRCRDGSVIEMDLRSHGVTYDGRPARVVVAHNVTERRRFEAALEDARRKAESASRAKSEFLASMSHELRSPLHTIIGFTELLGEELEGSLNERQKRFVQHIHRDSLHLLALINDVLDLSRIEAGRLEIQPAPFFLRGAVDEAVDTILPQAAAKGIHVDNDVATDLEVVGDRLRVKQVLLNLLSNAVKFTGTSGLVAIGADRLMEGGRVQVVTTVTDTGVGIAPEHRETIFELFRQVGETTRGVREGTGLGLAIVRKLVEQHQGRVWVESEVGKGSRFHFTLPAGGSRWPVRRS